MSKSDQRLEQDIAAELRWDTRINATYIDVRVDDAIVTLSGVVNTYAERCAAETATKRVGGVKTVVQSILVKIQGAHVRSDADLTSAVQTTLAWDVFVPKSVTAKVDRGAVVLDGPVAENFQREAAEQAIRRLAGVVSVRNDIRLSAQPSVPGVHAQIQAALYRQATADAFSIHVESRNGKVTLTGHASSWQSIEDAAEAAWAAPGVYAVIDDIQMVMATQ